jgi:ATP-dependent 26S proteasome regulatory subunit
MTLTHGIPDQRPFYRDNYEHLADVLRRLDLLIQLHVLEFRQRTPVPALTAASTPGLYIAHERVDWLLSQEATVAPELSACTDLRQQLDALQDDIDARVAESAARGTFLALPCLAQMFALSAFELHALVICLAPELRRKYDTLYAYVQDDITRKRPSVDLVLDLLCDSEDSRWKGRTAFSDHAPLFRAGLLHRSDDPQSVAGSSGLAQFLKLDQRILHFILSNNALDGRLDGLVTLLSPLPSLEHVLVEPALKSQVLHFVHRHFAEPTAPLPPMVLYFQGAYGAGQRDLALGLCGQWDRPLLCLDMERLLAQEAHADKVLTLVGREALLQGAFLLIEHVDAAWYEDGRAKALMKRLAQVAMEHSWLTFLAGEKLWSLQGLFGQAVFHALTLPMPTVPVRQAAWERALADLTPPAEMAWAGLLANQFRLTPGQINEAVAWAAHICAMRGESPAMTLADLYAGCRAQSNRKLAELAQQIYPRYGWEDIVLPEDKLVQLREICSHVTHRYQVFGDWGFDRKLSHGKGLSVLFAGPSGTGKTMAAEIMAHALQVDLYKIDLSGVVSKYIGETEKNLAKIFQEAESSNAILFFDEADAVFGKRTKIADAHDRYANIETSYLLQKMEEYEGAVILATNLRENLDEAFTRRMRFIVEFPFPDAASRQDIWQRHFPDEAPVSADVDCAWLAKQFQITGGHIKNIVLNAAFFAAEDGGSIAMEHVLHGARREFEKIGKLWNDVRFVHSKD